ncbi:glycosyltransferase family 87 protein [Hyphococcus formosus]|uniref:glycosyltransferase family 87 protein n=1 Tax=Hyphococcus formosus TaxID=3143534 RepID=UPI00398B1EF3
MERGIEPITFGRFKRDFDEIEGGVLRRGMFVSLVIVVFFIVNIGTIFSFPMERALAPVQDYFAFHAAAENSFNDVERLYDPEIFTALFDEKNGMLWLYPPTMLLVLFPFGLFPYGVAKVIWVIASCAGLGVAAYKITKGNLFLTVAMMLSPAAFAVLFTGQLSIFFACLALAGFLNAKSRPILSGICFGFLTLKPQFGLLVPVFLLCTGSWRAIFAAAVTTLFLVMVSIAAFGLEAWAAFFSSLTQTHTDYVQSVGHSGRITLADALRILGVADLSTALITLLSVGIGGSLIVLARRLGASIPDLTVLALLLTAITAPYFWVYDWLFVTFAALLFLRDRPTQPVWVQGMIVLVWFAPIAPYVGSGANLVPVIWLVLLGVVVAVSSVLLGLTGRGLRRQTI